MQATGSEKSKSTRPMEKKMETEFTNGNLSDPNEEEGQLDALIRQQQYAEGKQDFRPQSSGEGGNNEGSIPPTATEEEQLTEQNTQAAMTKIHGSAHEGTGTSISSHIQKIIAKELVPDGTKGRIDLQSVPMREYLEQTVIPIIHQGMLALGRERPDSPIEYLAAYLLKHKNKYQFFQEQPQLQEEDKAQQEASSVIAESEVPEFKQNDGSHGHARSHHGHGHR